MERVIDGKKFLVYNVKETIQQENETSLAYAERIYVEYAKCTHWLCEETSPDESVTKGKLYTFFKDSDGEYVITDDNGLLSMIWLVLEGDVLINISEV